MSAVLLPFSDPTTVDWAGFEAHVTRTAEAGLVPAVNMDTGYAHLLNADSRLEVLRRTKSTLAGEPFVAGAFDAPGAGVVAEHGATPVVLPSEALGPDVVAAYKAVAGVVDKFFGFELSPVFHPAGRIWDLETYRAVLDIAQCAGAKHSSLDRRLEWDRLRLRDEVRPSFQVFTGNDLAIDMVMYGSDYLLGLSTFAPELFARRDAMWEQDDDGFYELNDSLQHLGDVAFRPPVPAYRHDAAIFLKLRAWIASDAVPNGVPRRPDWEAELLTDAGRRLGVL